jgi:vacuolar-type H+-ATPase subunit I/STV1
MEEERVKLNRVFLDWNQQVYHAVERILESQRLAYEKELDTKHQRCMELERMVADLSGPVMDQLILLQEKAQAKDVAITDILERVKVLEEGVQMIKEIYKKTLDTTNEIRERVETSLEKSSLKSEPEEENEDIQEFHLMNRLETFRAAKAKLDEFDSKAKSAAGITLG